MADRAMDAYPMNEPVSNADEFMSQLDGLALEENRRLRQRLREYEREIADLRRQLDQYQPGRSIPHPPRERRR